MKTSRIPRKSLALARSHPADAQRLLQHLSVYLGHAHLAATQVYLTMTPELLHEAGTRFERYALGEDTHA
jgi:integrase/recombinase XerD